MKWSKARSVSRPPARRCASTTRWPGWASSVPMQVTGVLAARAGVRRTSRMARARGRCKEQFVVGAAAQEALAALAVGAGGDVRAVRDVGQAQRWRRRRFRPAARGRDRRRGRRSGRWPRWRCRAGPGPACDARLRALHRATHVLERLAAQRHLAAKGLQREPGVAEATADPQFVAGLRAAAPPGPGRGAPRPSR